MGFHTWLLKKDYLLIDNEVGVEEVDGVIDEETVEVVLGEEVLDVLLEDVHEVEERDGGVEARPEGRIVVLEGGNGAERKGLPVAGVELVVVHNDELAIIG